VSRRAAMLLPLIATLGTTPSVAQTTTLRNLAFGTIISGSTTTVSPTSVSAAEWRLRGLLGVGASFQLTLPTSLSGPGPSLPITFGATAGIYRVNNSNPVGGTTFNPHSPVSLPFALLVTDVYVFLGGSLNPPLNQTPGTYTGTVVLTSSGLL
jgi:hypothetical protein